MVVILRSIDPKPRAAMWPGRRTARRAALGALATLSLSAPAALHGQGAVVQACYGVPSGLVYRVGAPGILPDCLPRHVAFSLGPSGVSGVVVESATSASTSNDKTQTVSCPAGKVALGGGWSVSHLNGNLSPTADGPTGGSSSTPPTGWSASIVEDGNVGASWTVTVHVVCAVGG